MFKRAVDLLVASLAVLLLWPVLVAVAVAVRFRLGSPVLFRQLRPGLHGRPFRLVKFRTMTDARDASGQLLPDADRLPPFGRFLRSSSLDELPEIWNVLVGDMSIVGPRPLLMQYLPLYNARQARRHAVRPGITGWAQINGRNALGWEERLEMDVWYVENQRFWLDLKIFFLTFHKVSTRDGISAAGEATMAAFGGSGTAPPPQPTPARTISAMSPPDAPPRARIAAIASYLPEMVLDNDALAALYPEWPADKIRAKTGIRERRIAAADQTAGDLAQAAALALFEQGSVSASEIDFIILCTQAPDHVLPTTACLLQHKLGIPRTAGALDINLGCSGYVYGLSLAKGLVETGSAHRVLLLTADTYSKYIHPLDKSVRTLFGDGAAATLVCKAADGESGSIGPFVFGTDGSGAGKLIVEAGAFRQPATDETAVEHTDASGNVRSRQHLYMDGADVMTFSLTEVPKAVDALLAKTAMQREDIDLFVLHQANQFMLDALRKKLKVPVEKLPILVEHCGNTVSSTIPLALQMLQRDGRLPKGARTMLVGFGVGYSWAATTVQF